MQKWTRAFYQLNLPLKESGRVTASKEHIQLSKDAAAEGMILLKNEKNVLPLPKGSKIALFGKGSFDYVKGGGGSGDVTVSYIRNLYEGLKLQGDVVEIYEPLSDFYRENVKEQYDSGAQPGMTVEPELPTELLEQAKQAADTAILVLSRFSGEGWDRSSIEYDSDVYNPWGGGESMPQISGRIFPEGDFYLTKEEQTLIQQVQKSFDKVIVVLNTGGMIATGWIRDNDQISAALLAWQGGIEGGLAAAELLVGKKNPSGKLPDTFAYSAEDYPSTAEFHKSPDYVEYTEDIYVGYRYFETIPGAKEKVCYPFGFGLSYTTFSMENIIWTETEEQIQVSLTVKNTGNREGKEVVQVYYGAPQGKLGKPAKELAAFEKTKLLAPKESQTMTLSFAKAEMASYDDLGKIAKSARILEKGCYEFYIGTSVRDVEKATFTMELKEDIIVEQLSAQLVPSSLEKRMLADGTFEALPLTEANDPNACLLQKMVPGTEEALTPLVRARASYMLLHPYAEGVRPLMDVAEGKMTLEEFMEQLSDEDLIHLLGGQPNISVANTFGFGNLPEYGIPSVMTADGPAGLRIQPVCGVCTTAWPCATLLASTWNQELSEMIGKAAAEEVKENNISIWLAPAVNIHRNPLCGRNFEYYSEDPLLAGKTGAAVVKGIQSEHIAATVKHFACNNKETNRKHSDSRLSERALREIYLRVFEIIVKEAAPWAIMSSYNIINGWRTSESKELLENILRGEWGFDGVVMTDWWTRGEHYKELLAGNDIKMGCGFPERVKAAMEIGAVNREDLKHCAKRVLELILKID